MSTKKVLVTGHTGFLGQALRIKLERQGHIVVGCSTSTGQNLLHDDWYHGLPHIGYDYVFHTAAATFIPQAWEHPENFFALNVEGTRRVLDFCVEQKASLCYVSAYVYGTPQRLPINEGHPVYPDNPYGHSKFLGEQLCHFYCTYRHVPLTIVRPFNIYGPGQSEHFVIPHIIKQLQATGEVELTTAQTRRDFIYVDDVAQALIALLESNGKGTVYNLGSGGSRSIRSVVEHIASLMGYSPTIRIVPGQRTHDIMDAVADISRFTRDFGPLSLTNFHEGLRRCVSHFLRNLQ